MLKEPDLPPLQMVSIMTSKSYFISFSFAFLSSLYRVPYMFFHLVGLSGSLFFSVKSIFFLILGCTV